MRYLIIACFLLSGSILFGQDKSSSFTPADSTFGISVTRVGTETEISLWFSEQLTFVSCAIERKPEFDQNFSQCKYIGFEDVKKNHHMIKKDAYPYPKNVDMQYRLKLVMPDGVVRIYPPVTLPQVK